jgi:NADH-quinone oxidoreductase subunit D
MTPLSIHFATGKRSSRFSKYCGARLTTHAFRIGGCLYETYAGFEKGELSEISAPTLTNTKNC